MEALSYPTINALFLSKTQFQVAAISIYLLLLFNYIRTKKLPILSTYSFSAMMVFSGINLIFDVVTVFTITNIDSVSPRLNRIAHQVFIGSLDSVIFCLALYVLFLGRQQKRFKSGYLLLISAPYLLSLLIVAFGPLDYFNDGNAAYSFGAMANSVYLEIFIYMLLINIYMLKQKKTLDAKTREAVHAGTLIWIIIAVVQGINHSMLVSSMCVSLMLLFVYLSFVNPGEMLDKETGAFTRYAFNLMLSEAFSRRRKHEFFIVGLSFEDMSKINGQIGNANSTRLLAMIREHFRACFKTDIYHYRGSAMAAIVRCDQKKVQEYANKLMERFSSPWSIDKLKVYVRCHTDIILCPDYAQTPDEVIDLLDYMFELQDEESGVFPQIADHEMIAKRKRINTITGILEKAVQEEGFDVVFQPIFNTQNKKFCSAEALVRLKDQKTLGFVGPDEFIPVAEHLGLISDLGLIVFRKVCAFSAEQRLWEKGLEYIEVNLSGEQIMDKHLPDTLKAEMDSQGIPYPFINFEITESVAVESGPEALATLDHIREQGSCTSMDDFGTGYSNLSQLAVAAYDLIKLDKSLIWPCFAEGGQNASVILDSMINLVLCLDRQIVAEGIETQQQADYLTERGVRYLQGYLYSRPLYPQDFIAFLEKNKPF